MLDILVQSRRNAKAAQRFFRKLLRSLQYPPRVIAKTRLPQRLLRRPATRVI